MERPRPDEPVVLEFAPAQAVAGWRALWLSLGLASLGVAAVLALTETLISARIPILRALVSPSARSSRGP